jgi:hypothetical protein
VDAAGDVAQLVEHPLAHRPREQVVRPPLSPWAARPHRPRGNRQTQATEATDSFRLAGTARGQRAASRDGRWPRRPAPRPCRCSVQHRPTRQRPRTEDVIAGDASGDTRAPASAHCPYCSPRPRRGRRRWNQSLGSVGHGHIGLPRSRRRRYGERPNGRGSLPAQHVARDRRHG